MLARDRSSHSFFDLYGTSKTQVWHAVAREAFLDNPEQLVTRIYAGVTERSEDNQLISEAEFKELYPKALFAWDKNMTHVEAERLFERKQQEQANITLMQSGKGGVVETVGAIGAALGASLLSPINVALSCVPIGGQARWAQLAAKIGKFPGMLAKGATSGAVFQLGMEPLVQAARVLEQSPPDDASEIAKHVGVAAMLGAGLQALGYGAQHLKRRFFHNSEHSSLQAANRVDDVHKNVLESGQLSQMEHTHAYPQEASQHPQIHQENNQIRQKEAEERGGIFAQNQEVDQGLPGQLSKHDLLIGRHQIAEGKHLDLENPAHAPSMMESERFAEPEHSSNHHSSQSSNHLSDSLEQQYQDLLEVLKDIYPEKELQLSKLGAQGQEALEGALQRLREGRIEEIEPLLKIAEEAALFDNPRAFTDRVRQLAQMVNPEKDQLSPFNIQEATAKLAQEYKKVSLVAKRNQVVNMKRFADCKEQITSYGSPVLGLKQLLKTVDLRQKTVVNSLRNNLLLSLEENDLVQVFKSKHYQADIARELHALNGGVKPPGYTGSQNALRVAEIIHKIQDYALKRANLAGSHIENLPGYITRQMHNPMTIRKLGFARWQQTILPLLDHQKTFTEGNVDLQQVFEALATGKHLHHLDEYLHVPHVAETSSIATALSASRKLHFKDADSWLFYNQQYGVYELKDSILMHLDRIGHSIGLLETLGTRPHDLWQNLKQDCMVTLRSKAAGESGNSYAIEELQKISSLGFDKELDLLMGHNAPDNPTLASVSQSLRSLKTMASLGKVVLSCFPDMATFAVEQQRNGIPLLTSYGNIIKALTHQFSSKDKKSFARTLGIAVDSVLGHSYNRLNAEYPVAGHITKATNVFFKLNGMEWWDNSFKSTMGLVLSQHMAEHVHLPFSEIPKSLQHALSTYGIEESQWKLFKACTAEIDGHRFVSPEKIRELPDARIAELLDELNHPVNAETIRAARGNLEEAMRGYLLDRIDTACPTPHAAERAMVTMGTKPGTPLGEFVRFFMQFKSFPITFIQRPLKSITVDGLPKAERTGRAIDVARSLSNPNSLLLMSQLFVGTTVLGYLSLCANKLLQGKDIPDIEDPKVWQAAMLKGGGLGLYGDFLFGEYSRYGRSLTSEMLGPVLSDVNSIASLYGKAKEGNWSKVEDDAFNLIKRNLPGRNLFYLEPIMALFA
jgi:hypothetical protein